MRRRPSASVRQATALVAGTALVALFIATPASSRPTAGISVSALEPVTAIIGPADSSGVYQMAIVVAARFRPEVLHDDARVTFISRKPGGLGASPFTGYDSGNILHTTAAYQNIWAGFEADRILVTVKWNAYTPQPSGTVSGSATASTVVQLPTREPAPRLVSEKKQRLAQKSTDRFAACAIAGIAAGLTAEAPPLAVAFAALAAESCAAGTMYQQLALDPVDPSFRRVAKPKRLRALRVTAGEGLSASAAAAVNELLGIQAREISLGRAIVTAFNRSQGAHVKKQTGWERKQVLAAGAYAAELSALMVSEARLRPKVRALLTRPVTVTEEQAYAFQRSLLNGSVPAAMTADLRRLGLTKEDLKEVRAQLIVRNHPTLLDGNAVAVIADPKTLAQLREVAADLRDFAKDAVRDPLNTAT